MKDERDLDFYARRIQALYRGRQDRLNLKGLQRVHMPPVAAIVPALVQDAVAKRVAAVVTESVSAVGLRGLLHNYRTVVLQLTQPTHLWPNWVAALAQGCGAQVETLLVAGRSHLRGQGMCVLIDAMRSNQLKRLRVLAIGPNEIVADVPGCMPCRSVNLADNYRIRAPHSDLSTCLQTAHFQLRELVIEENDLEDTGVMHIANGVGDYFFGRSVVSPARVLNVSSYGHLERLVLAHVKMGDTACTALGAALSINTTLRVLDLHGNRVTDAGATVLATGFMASRTLVTLDLGDNSIGSTGAKALFLAMESSVLSTLLLVNNNVKNDVMASLRKLMAAKKGAVACIELRGNLIHVDHMTDIQSWFAPESHDDGSETAPTLDEAFDAAKRQLLAPRKVQKGRKLDVLAKMRRERREMPLTGYDKPVSQLLKLPALPSRTLA
ncbi:Aste57867_12198 [Aphanomyces stellatus]|uniref:Aste57867_12198 protein n=1 Tax=Aphanomyces stellatus TaxID=120398 RepID=A0A485KWB4_9STRA|nr:hypothetical protein As57867_012153 [Aphanomyces stellatus]VFT89052.1 Aste57867_12198 [Aphanomyces stellatus]